MVVLQTKPVNGITMGLFSPDLRVAKLKISQ